MNRRKLEILLGSMTMVVAFFAWLSVSRAVTVPDSSTWAVPMILFSAYLILICLDIILFRELLLLELILIGSLALSFLITPAWLQIGAIFISSYFLFVSSRNIREDMELNIKISIWKSLQAGKSFLLMAVTLLIAMQYFTVINNFAGEKKVPHFDVSFVTKKVAIPFVSAINPQFKVLKDETLTVDQFILQSQDAALKNLELNAENEQLVDSKIPLELPAAQRDALKKQAMEKFIAAQQQVIEKNQELILIDGRRQLSELSGNSLTGSEKISDVFTGLVSNKIDEYFNPKTAGGQKSSVFAIILATVLLLTIYPLGSVMTVVWFLLVKFVIFIFLKSDVLKVGSMTVSKEILE
jgi:hypothetical protein